MNGIDQMCGAAQPARPATPTFRQSVGRWLFPRLPITRLLFDTLRDEVRAFIVRFKNRCVPARRRRLRRLLTLKDVYLNVACGPQVLPEFINIDLRPSSSEIVAWDARRTLPVSDGSARGIRAEQFLEHLETREELPAFLQACHRALAPGGVLRLIVPDAERFLKAYCRGDLAGFHELDVPDPFPHDLPTRMDVINHLFHQWHEHRWAYDFETLAHRLNGAGFTNVKCAGYLRSHDPRLAGDRSVHMAYSLYVDAIK